MPAQHCWLAFRYLIRAATCGHYIFLHPWPGSHFPTCAFKYPVHLTLSPKLQEATPSSFSRLRLTTNLLLNLKETFWRPACSTLWCLSGRVLAKAQWSRSQRAHRKWGQHNLPKKLLKYSHLIPLFMFILSQVKRFYMWIKVSTNYII